MPTHEAIFISDTSKSGYEKNECRTIVTEQYEGKIRVTSPGAWPGPDAIMYDSTEEFFKDWEIRKTYGTNGDERIDIARFLKENLKLPPNIH